MSVPRTFLRGAIALLVLRPAAGPAATIRVPEDRSSLTAAVRAARAGDEILLAPQRFSEDATGESFPIRLAGKALRIRGAAGPATTLDAGRRGRHFVFTDGDRSTLEDLRLVGGSAPEGGGSLLVAGGHPELVRVVFEDNVARRDGDAILVRAGNPRLANCLFLGHEGDGPTVCVAGGSPSFLRCTWGGNGGPALELRGTARPRVERCVIASPGAAGGVGLGFRIVAEPAGKGPVLIENLFLDCADGVVRVDGEAGLALAAALEEGRRAHGLRAVAASPRDPDRGDWRPAPGTVREEDLGAWGGDAALPAPAAAAVPEVSRGGEPREPLLGPTVPNPFAPSTTIHFRVPEPSLVDLGVYTVAGQRVRTLPAGDLPAGEHEREWDGRDDRGEDLPPGIYFVRITIGGATESRRLVLVR